MRHTEQYMRYLIGLVVVGLIAFYLGGYAPQNYFPEFSWSDMSTTTDEVVLEETTTGATTPAAKPSTPTSSGEAGKRFMQNGVYVTIVEYSDTGFNPSKLEINRGEEVRFVNKDNETMYIVADNKLSSPVYAQLNMPNSLGKGGTYQLAFTQPGIFSYQNVNKNWKPAGQIFVK